MSKNYKVKQVILIRRDLKMRRGKEIAQGSHASFGVFLESKFAEIISNGKTRGYESEDILEVKLWDGARHWIEGNFAKICLQVHSEHQMLELVHKAKVAGIPAVAICDSGQTEFHGKPTWTAAAIGPFDSEEIDKLTGDLELY